MGMWDTMTAYHLTGLAPAQPAASAGGVTPVAPSVERSTGPTSGTPPLWSPENGLFWFGVILAATVGLAAASTSIRLGPFKAGVSLGDTKK